MQKNIFDFLLAFLLLCLSLWIIFIAVIVSSLDTQSIGLFIQKRIGRHGSIFKIFKIKTIDSKQRISAFGRFLRKSKLDELPQLLNVLIGDMSFVGPRPDIPGYYDELEGEERKILELKPGITSLASIKYKDEEELLSRQTDPLRYNDEVIFKDKVKMNLEYYYTRTFIGDVKILIKTIFG